MDKDEIRKKTEEIEKIYQEYVGKVKELKKEQDKILGDFLHELEKAKMEEIRNKLKS